MQRPKQTTSPDDSRKDSLASIKANGLKLTFLWGAHLWSSSSPVTRLKLKHKRAVNSLYSEIKELLIKKALFIQALNASKVIFLKRSPIRENFLMN